MPDTSPAQDLADELTARGIDWQRALPSDAEIVYVDDPTYRDTVRLGDQQIYLTDYNQWIVLGWSDASRSRQFRTQPPSTADLWPSHGYDE